MTDKTITCRDCGSEFILVIAFDVDSIANPVK